MLQILCMQFLTCVAKMCPNLLLSNRTINNHQCCKLVSVSEWNKSTGTRGGEDDSLGCSLGGPGSVFVAEGLCQPWHGHVHTPQQQLSGSLQNAARWLQRCGSPIGAKGLISARYHSLLPPLLLATNYWPTIELVSQ